jgi:hypothetical protein
MTDINNPLLKQAVVAMFDEPLTSTEIDPDPDFRIVLGLLNDSKVHTVSSCQGHAPGTQYSDVTEWMSPYITVGCRSPDEAVRAEGLLQLAGAMTTRIDEIRVMGELMYPLGVRAKFPNGWDWKRSIELLEG